MAGDTPRRTQENRRLFSPPAPTGTGRVSARRSPSETNLDKSLVFSDLRRRTPETPLPRRRAEVASWPTSTQRFVEGPVMTRDPSNAARLSDGPCAAPISTQAEVAAPSEPGSASSCEFLFGDNGYGARIAALAGGLMHALNGNIFASCAACGALVEQHLVVCGACGMNSGVEYRGYHNSRGLQIRLPGDFPFTPICIGCGRWIRNCQRVVHPCGRCGAAQCTECVRDPCVRCLTPDRFNYVGVFLCSPPALTTVRCVHCGLRPGRWCLLECRACDGCLCQPCTVWVPSSTGSFLVPVCHGCDDDWSSSDGPGSSGSGGDVGSVDDEGSSEDDGELVPSIQQVAFHGFLGGCVRTLFGDNGYLARGAATANQVLHTLTGHVDPQLEEPA